MKKLFTFIFILVVSTGIAFCGKHTITNSGTKFTPAEITIEPGDTVVFSLGSIHNAVEVSEATYMANGQTSNGGFNLDLGGGTVVFPTEGTFYFVCQPHASIGMKGIIHVGTPSLINQTNTNATGLAIFPNPAVNNIMISYFIISPSQIEVDLINLTGAKIATIMNDFQEIGQQVLNYDFTDKIVPGIYFITIRANETVTIKKFVVE